MSNRTKLATLSLEVTTETQAYAYFEGLRWYGNPVCFPVTVADVAGMQLFTVVWTRARHFESHLESKCDCFEFQTRS
jgi:hypothetical protein